MYSLQLPRPFPFTLALLLLLNVHSLLLSLFDFDFPCVCCYQCPSTTVTDLFRLELELCTALTIVSIYRLGLRQSTIEFVVSIVNDGTISIWSFMMTAGKEWKDLSIFKVLSINCIQFIILLEYMLTLLYWRFVLTELC